MAITEDHRIVIREILKETLDDWDALFEKYNFFTSDQFRAENGDIGWEILVRTAEKEKKYRYFIRDLSEKPALQREAGIYVYDLIRKCTEDFPV